jgi:predicted RNA-binding Zn-ribbon protein involved in translation (DUF1610 family)
MQRRNYYAITLVASKEDVPMSHCVKCGIEIDEHQRSHFLGRCPHCFDEWETFRINVRLSGCSIVALAFLFLFAAMQWGIGLVSRNAFLLFVAGTIAFGLSVFLWARGELSKKGTDY